MSLNAIRENKIVAKISIYSTLNNLKNRTEQNCSEQTQVYDITRRRTSGSGFTICIKIDKPLVIYILN